MTAPTDAPAATGKDTAIAPRLVHGDVIAVYESILEDVPDAGGEGIEAILEQLAAAGSVAELNSPWEAGGLKGYVDTPLVVTGIRKMPSDFDGGLSYFLVIDGAVRATGEKIAATSGSISVVAALLRCYNMGAFPVVAIPRYAKRETKDGNRPMHLEFPGA